jgi:cytochrome c
MKKYLLVSLIFAAMIACNSNDTKEEKKDTSSTTENKDASADLSNNPDYQKGLELVAKSDCLTCHKIDEKIQGPTYRDVANKYAGMPDTIIGHLAQKIIKGGSGVWAEMPLMTPHPTLSEADAEAMVKYILLLKK